MSNSYRSQSQPPRFIDADRWSWRRPSRSEVHHPSAANDTAGSEKECNSRPCQSPSGLAALSVTPLSRLQEAYGERLHLHLDAQFYDLRGRYQKVLGRATEMRRRGSCRYRQIRPLAPRSRERHARDPKPLLQSRQQAPRRLPLYNRSRHSSCSFSEEKLAVRKSTNCIGLGVPNRQIPFRAQYMEGWEGSKSPGGACFHPTCRLRRHFEKLTLKEPPLEERVLRRPDVGASLRRFDFGSWPRLGRLLHEVQSGR